MALKIQLNLNVQKQQPATDGIPISYAFHEDNVAFSVWQSPVRNDNTQANVAKDPKWRQPKRRQFENGDRPKREQTKTGTNQNGDNQNGDCSKMATDRKLERYAASILRYF